MYFNYPVPFLQMGKLGQEAIKAAIKQKGDTILTLQFYLGIHLFAYSVFSVALISWMYLCYVHSVAFLQNKNLRQGSNTLPSKGVFSAY